MSRIDMIRSAGRYIIVGASSTLLQYSVLMFLVEFLGIDPKYASMTGFITGCLFHYLLLYYWTFQASGSHLNVVPRYFIVTFITFWMNFAVFFFLFDFCEIGYLFAQLFATLAVAVINFLVNRSYTFS